MLHNSILPDEELTDLCIKNRKVLQKKQGFRFSLDAVLLAHFIAPKKQERLLDLGTGSAVIPLLLNAYHPQLWIDGIELQAELADMAQRSVLYNHLQEHIHIIQQDMTQLPAQYYQQYDWVVSNPPFFPADHGKLSPNRQIALARHELACTLEQVVSIGARCLKSRGHFALIHRAERLPELLQHCQKHQLAPLRLRFVHATAKQPAKLFLLEAVRHGHNGLTVLPPLILTQADGSNTDELAAYFQTS